MTEISIRQFFEDNAVPCFPMCVSIHPKTKTKIDLTPTGETLSNGDLKMGKCPLGEKFGSASAVTSYYGKKLGNWLLENNMPAWVKKEIKKNPDFGARGFTPTMRDFDFPEEILKLYCKKRWRGFDMNTEPNIWDKFNKTALNEYDTIAYDTRVCGVFDIDMILSPDSPFNELMKWLVVKNSSTKIFGRHIFVLDKELLAKIRTPTRTKLDLPKKYGVCKNGTAGIEWLSGIWGWAKITDKIKNPERAKNPVPEWAKQILLKLNSINRNVVRGNNIMSGGETKTSREPTTPAPVIPMATAVAQAVGISSYPLEIIQENLARYAVESMSEYQKWAGVCISFASSNCEEVFKLLVASCKRHGANFGGVEKIREKWDLYNPDQHAIPDPVTGNSYKKTFDTWWCVKHKEQFDWKGFMLDDDMFIQKKFVKDHKHNFIFNACYDEHNLCYFDEKTTLWRHNRKKGIAKKVIKKILMNETRQYWADEMEASIEGMADPEADDDGVVPPNKFKELCIKFKNKTLKKFYSTGGWASGTITNIINLLECELEEEHIQFNLMEITKDYFQFKNKAYDLRNGALIDRTREMYVSAGGVLDYEFPETGDISELNKEMKIIDKMMTTILPNPAIRRLFCLWRGYNLTGHTNAQMFFVFLGEGAENGKSTLCEIFQVSFPVYVNPIDNDAIDDKAKNDKSLSSCLDKPYRILFIEEAEKIGKKIKKCVNFETCRIKPLYCEETTLMINFGLELLTNGGIDASTDNGVLRRGRTLMFESKFTCNPEEVDEEQHIYLADQTLVPRFKDDIKMKLALFLYFAKFSKEYYDMGINDFKGEFEICKVAFKAEQASDDPWESFINDRFVKTEDESDVIWKKDMMRYVIEEFGDNEYTTQKTNGDWDFKPGVFSRVICNNFRKRRYKYESGLRGRDVNGNLQKGMFHNIKYVPYGGGQESDGEEEYN